MHDIWDYNEHLKYAKFKKQPCMYINDLQAEIGLSIH